MDLKDVLESRDRQIRECRDLIMSLDNLKDLDETRNLKKLLHSKKDLLVNMNTENYQDTIKKLEIIDEKIYVSSNILRNQITNLWEFIDFNPNLINLVREDRELNFIDIIKFGINHQFISTFIFFLIGGLVFSLYFLKIDYFPSLNKENFIYFLFLLSSIGILYMFLFLSIPIIVQKIFLKIFQIQYINKNKKIELIIFVLLIPIIVFIFGDTSSVMIQIILSLGIILSISYITYRFSSNFSNRIKILVSTCVIFILMIFFISIVSQLYEYIFQNKDLIGTLIVLSVGILTISFVLYEKYVESILYVIYLILMIVILISTSSDVIKLLHFGNYTPDAIILDPKAKAIIPSGFLDSNNTISKPKVLSNIGDEYYIELKESNTKAIHLSIPKDLVLSEQTKVEEKQDKPKDTKQHSKPKENTSQ